MEKQEAKKRTKAREMAKEERAQEKRAAKDLARQERTEQKQAAKDLARQERAEQKQAAKKLAKQECSKEKGAAKQLTKQERVKEKLPASKTARGKRAGKKAPLSQFQRMTATLSGSEQSQLREYFRQLDRHILLPKEWKTPMLHDFEQGILYHLQKGRSLTETLELLDPLNLGGFYSCPATMWWPLDNAAKVYPISMSHEQMEVFRLSVYLKEEVVPEILQLALTFTIKRFPFFATTIKNGFFWHYIDATKRRFAVEPESAIPCAPINVSSTGAQSFRIIYYHNRISAEFFHILFDASDSQRLRRTDHKDPPRLLELRQSLALPIVLHVGFAEIVEQIRIVMVQTARDALRRMRCAVILRSGSYDYDLFISLRERPFVGNAA